MFPTMWYVRPAKPQISLRICAVWPESLLVTWIFYDCQATDWISFGVSKLQRRLHRLVCVYTHRWKLRVAARLLNFQTVRPDQTVLTKFSLLTVFDFNQTQWGLLMSTHNIWACKSSFTSSCTATLWCSILVWTSIYSPPRQHNNVVNTLWKRFIYVREAFDYNI